MAAGNPIAAYLLAAGMLVALLPAYLYLAPASSWAPEDLFAILLVFGFLSKAAAVRLRTDLIFDSGFIGLLLATVFLGPLPAAVIGMLSQIPHWIDDQRFFMFVSNLASYACAPLAAVWTLGWLGVGTPFEDGGATAYLAIVVAGAVLICVNYLVATFLVDVVHDGLPLPARVRLEFTPTLPEIVGLLIVGALTAFLYVQLGVVGLAPLLGLLVLPRLLTPRLVRARPLSELQRAEATAVYAGAIADVLHLDRRRKRVIADAATHLGGHATLSNLNDFSEVMQAVLYSRECWDGEGGFPGLVAGEKIPLESRILAVAEAWGAETARGTRELTPAEALARLRADSGADSIPAWPQPPSRSSRTTCSLR